VTQFVFVGFFHGLHFLVSAHHTRWHPCKFDQNFSFKRSNRAKNCLRGLFWTTDFERISSNLKNRI
jgi:hypothetical protein